MAGTAAPEIGMITLLRASDEVELEMGQRRWVATRVWRLDRFSLIPCRTKRERDLGEASHVKDVGFWGDLY
jgi:hypothetical protein